MFSKVFLLFAKTFQLHLIRERKLAYSSFNQAVCALRFYFTHTQPTPWPVTMVPFGKRPKKLPTVLSRQEVEQLIECTANRKHRTFIMTLYACEQLTLVQLLRCGAAKFTDLARCPTVQSVLAKISVCRTHVMGGRKYQCSDCGETTSRYNSCGDRHCPCCAGSKRFDFNEKASKLLLPEANPQMVYYQVVCTLPSELSELALANQQVMADLLVGSAWKTLMGTTWWMPRN